MRQENLTDDRIESLIREASTTFQPPADMKTAMRERLVSADESLHTETADIANATAESSDGARRGRFRLFAHPWRLASAASFLLIAGAFAAYVLWPTQLTLAQVREAVEKVEWVYLKFDNGEEQWINVPRKITARVAIEPEYTVYIDYVKGIRWSKFGSREYINKGEIDSSWDMGTTAWDRIVGPVEEQIEQSDPNADLPDDPRLAEIIRERRSRHWTESHPDVIDGRPVIRFDSFWIDPLGQELLMRQLWADPVDRLPVQERRRLQLGERDRQNPDQAYITARYEFPKSGPESIYDLGVARSVQVVEQADVAPDDQAVEIVNHMKAAALAFPTRYRQLHWRDDAIFILHWNGSFASAFDGRWLDTTGVRMHWQQFFTSQWNDDGTMAESSPLTPGDDVQALDWAGKHQPVAIRVADGKRIYSQRGPYPESYLDADKVDVRVMDMTPGSGPSPLPSSQSIVDVLWPLADGHTGELVKQIDSSDDDSANLIHLRVDGGGQRQDCFVDPNLDYICVRWVVSNLKEGEWVVWMDRRLEDLVQLPTGHWYPRTLQRLDSYEVNGTPHSRELVWSYHIDLLDDSDLPVAMFDIDALLEKAREMGATIETH